MDPAATSTRPAAPAPLPDWPELEPEHPRAERLKLVAFEAAVYLMMILGVVGSLNGGPID